MAFCNSFRNIPLTNMNQSPAFKLSRQSQSNQFKNLSRENEELERKFSKSSKNEVGSRSMVEKRTRDTCV